MHWNIEKTNLQIVGAVHVSNRSLSLPSKIIDAVNNASVLAFEANFDFAPNLKSMYYEKANCLSKNISSSLFANTKQLWSNLELPIDELESLQPWWVTFRLMSVLMSKNGFVTEHGIDRRILNIAKKENKKLFFLEATNAGLAPFAVAPSAEQEVFLSDIVLNTEEVIREIADLIVAWQSGAPLMLQPFVEKALTLMPVTYSNALAGRNRIWLQHIMRLAKSHKNVVVVVGALHMVGPENIPYLLAAEGLTCSLANGH